MAQPMTLTATPDPTPATANPKCPAGVSFCTGACLEFGDAGYHSGDFAAMKVKRPTGRYRGEDEVAVVTFREDGKKKRGKAKVALLTGLRSGDQVNLSPARTRELAAILLNAADDADPLPLGVVIVAVEGVRLHDEILTEDGWQNVVGQMAFTDQVNVWTDGPDRDPETDGWRFQPGMPVAVRRQTAGSPFVMWEAAR